MIPAKRGHNHPDGNSPTETGSHGPCSPCKHSPPKNCPAASRQRPAPTAAIPAGADFERDGSEVYTYTASDDMLVIRIEEVLDEEPNEDYSPDEPEHWAVDKRTPLGAGNAALYGDPRGERTEELFQLGQSVRTDPNDREKEQTCRSYTPRLLSTTPTR